MIRDQATRPHVTQADLLDPTELLTFSRVSERCKTSGARRYWRPGESGRHRDDTKVNGHTQLFRRPQPIRGSSQRCDHLRLPTTTGGSTNR